MVDDDEEVVVGETAAQVGFHGGGKRHDVCSPPAATLFTECFWQAYVFAKVQIFSETKAKSLKKFAIFHHFSIL